MYHYHIGRSFGHARISIEVLSKGVPALLHFVPTYSIDRDESQDGNFQRMCDFGSSIGTSSFGARANIRFVFERTARIKNKFARHFAM